MNDGEFSDNVVPFPRGQFEKASNEREALLDELPVRTDQTLRACFHREHGTKVSEGARTVKCRGCDVDLDPIEVLSWLARDRENLVWQGRRLRNERDYLEQEVEKLKRDERNAKARIRRARTAREDEAALIAAASVASGVGGYRPWDECSEAQQSIVIERVRQVVEAYHGALRPLAARDEVA